MQIQVAAKRALSLALAGAITVSAAVPSIAAEEFVQEPQSQAAGETLSDPTPDDTPQNAQSNSPEAGSEAASGEPSASSSQEAGEAESAASSEAASSADSQESASSEAVSSEAQIASSEEQEPENEENANLAKAFSSPVSLSVNDIESVQAYTDATFYGTGVVEVDVTYKDGVDLSGITTDAYILEDRGSLDAQFGKIDLSEVSVSGNVVSLTIQRDFDATAANEMIYTGADKKGSRQRNSYGIYVTGAWYRDAVTHEIVIGQKGQQGYQARECLELRLRHADEAEDKALCLADSEGKYTAANKWQKTIDRQFGDTGFKNLYDLKIDSTGAGAANGDDYVQGYYYVPENYDPSNGIVFTLQGQGISFWKLENGTNNARTGIMYDSATTSWANQGAIVVNIHDRSTTYTLPDNYDFVLDDVNVMKYFIDNYQVTGPIVLQGNSRGTMASDIVIKALAGCEYDPAEQRKGAVKTAHKTLDKSVYDFTIDTYICQNGSFGGSFETDESGKVTMTESYWDDNTGDWETIAKTGLRAWIFDGEQDTNNIEAYAKWQDTLAKLGMPTDTARLTGLTSDLNYLWGESDHSATRINGWYFADNAYYGPDLHLDAQGNIVYDTKLKDGDTYTLKGRGAAGENSKKGYQYTVYDDSFHAWALREKAKPYAPAAQDLQNKVISVQAAVAPNFYGQRVSEVKITFAADVTEEQLNAANIQVYDRGTLTPDFGALTVADRKISGSTVTLTIGDGTDGSDKLTDRTRNSFGMLNTAGWYMDSAGNIYCNNATQTPGQDNLGNTVYQNQAGKTCQGRSLDLILCVNNALENGIRSTDLKGNFLNDTVWSKPIVTGGNEKIETEYVDLTGKTVTNANGDTLDLSTGYTQVGDGKSVPVQVIYPDGYDKNRAESYPAIVYQCGGGVCYWEVAAGDKNNIAPANNLGCNTVYDNMLAQWHSAMPEAVIMAVNVHSGPSTEVSAAEINEVIRYAQANWNIADKVVIVGNSQGTIITSDAIRQAPELFAGFVECNGNFGGNVNSDIADCDGTVANSSFKYWTQAEVNAMIGANVAAWLFNGETDGTNPGIAQDTYTTLVNLYKAAGKSDEWIAAHVRASGLQSWKFMAMGETDHSVTKFVADKYVKSAYNDVTENGTVLNAGEHYSIYSNQADAAYPALYQSNPTVFEKFKNFQYTVYAESVSEWAKNLFSEQNGESAVDFDSVADLAIDYSQAAQLPLTGYFTKSLANGRSVKVYIAPETSVRSYFTIVAVPDGVTDTYSFLQQNGWIDLADQKGEGLYVLEPGVSGWGTAQEEADYLNSAISFLKSGTNESSQTVFSTFGEFYLVGYGKGASALELWAAENPIFVIAQTYIDGVSAGATSLTNVASTLYDGKSSNGDLTSVLDETIRQLGRSGRIAPKDVPVPTILANYTGSESYWKAANDCEDSAVNGVYAQKIDSKAYATEYANSVRKANGETTGLSQVKIVSSAAKLGNAADIYNYMAQWTRYDTTFAYSNALNTRLDYTAAKIAAQTEAKDGTVKSTLSDGKTTVLGQGKVSIAGHGTVEMGVFAFSDQNGDGKNDPREYLLYIPESRTRAAQKMPVVMIYPGNTQTDMIFMDSTMWWQTAEKEGVMLAFVCETYSSPVAVTHVDSGKYYDSLLTLLKDEYGSRIDLTRLYASGQSMGSNETQGFAVREPERFAAVATTSGAPFNVDGAAGKLIPAMMITGHVDAGDMAKGFDSSSLQAWGSTLLNADGLSAAFTAAGASEVTSVDARHPAVYTWKNASGIPLLRWGQSLLRPHNPFPGDTALLWDFMKHYSMDANGNRYYSASAFAQNDLVKIAVASQDSSSGSGSSSSSSKSSKQETVYHSVTAIAHEGGTISSKGVFGVAEGTSKYYEISPNAGCTVARVIVDGVDIGAVSNYTFQNIRGNHTIEVFFSGSGISSTGRANPQTGILD